MSLYGGSSRPHILAAPSAGPTPAPASRKRKGREVYHPEPEALTVKLPSTQSTSSSSSSSLLGQPRPPHVRKLQPWYLPQAVTKQPAASMASVPGPAKPGGNRQLMAGYLAHEFLSHGTLFGRPYSTSTIQAAVPSSEDELRQKQKRQYQDVARIMWVGGVHVPGVVNPTQLGGWLEKQQ